MFVAGVLIMASATAGEILASRKYAVRGRLENRIRLPSCESRLLFGEGGFDFLCGENKGKENCFASSKGFRPRIGGRGGGKASEAVASINQLFNCEQQVLILTALRFSYFCCITNSPCSTFTPP